MCNYERNLKGFYAHMRKHTSTHYLADQPEILSEKGLAKPLSTIGNLTKGTHCSVPIINWGLELLLSYLNTKAYDQNIEEMEDEALYSRNISTIKSPALLQEMLAYNSDINVDRISSLILLMIIREDRINISKNAFSKKVEVVTSNSFWNRAYKKPVDTGFKRFRP